MKMKQKYKKSVESIEDKVSRFLEIWDLPQMLAFLADAIPIFELYDCSEDDDWVRRAVGEESEHNVRLMRTAYLVSKFAENHASKIAEIKICLKELWRDMEKEVEEKILK